MIRRDSFLKLFKNIRAHGKPVSLKCLNKTEMNVYKPPKMTRFGLLIMLKLSKMKKRNMLKNRKSFLKKKDSLKMMIIRNLWKTNGDLSS